ncbi:16S rRNA (adenine(1518)-N(6)/adenine(1519)-N(6))-dimethyltransferaseRsmA [soil metagenome]
MNLVDPGTLKALLSRHSLSASKGLGQHFLISSTVVNRIVGSFDDCRGILEIGPGPGVLTGPLSEHADRMIALEIDGRMPALLAESAPKAEIRNVDALESPLGPILEELPEPRGLVSNLPYYITGPLLTRIAENRRHFSKAVLMMQKEVGLRVLAEPKSSTRGSLSVFLQSQFTIRKVIVAPAGAFLPPPKVDSLVLEFIPHQWLPQDIERIFFKIVRVGFTQPRKTLINNFQGLGLTREASQSLVINSGLGELARPQEITNDQWLNVARQFQLVAADQ